MLSVIYSTVTIYAFASAIHKLSFIKAENVVKPPQNPVIRSNLVLCDDSPSRSPYNRPTIKHPITFTANVPHGNTPCVTLSDIRKLTRYLIALPTPPPNATMSNDFIIYLIKLVRITGSSSGIGIPDFLPFSSKRNNQAILRPMVRIV